MKTYWDTTAAINALINPAVRQRLEDGGEHLMRPHMCAEFFGVMTGRGVQYIDSTGTTHRIRMDNASAAAWLRRFSRSVQFVELTGEETVGALESARAKGVQGPQIHDLLHVCAAEKGGADRIITRNTSDFSSLTKLQLVWP